MEGFKSVKLPLLKLNIRIYKKFLYLILKGLMMYKFLEDEIVMEQIENMSEDSCVKSGGYEDGQISALYTEIKLLKKLIISEPKNREEALIALLSK